MTLNPIEPERKSKAVRIILSIVLSLLGILTAIFLALFVYYLWQIKYGAPEKLARDFRKFESGKFTLIDGANQAGPKITKDINSYVRKNNPTAGNPKGKITILAFIDFTCPYTQESYPIFNQVMEKYGSVARIVIKHLPLISINPEALGIATAAGCAGTQQKYFQYYDLLFKNLKFTRTDLNNYAIASNLDINKFTACVNNQINIDDIDTDTRDAIELGVRGTPTYFINQDIIEGSASLKTWDETIIRNLK